MKREEKVAKLNKISPKKSRKEAWRVQADWNLKHKEALDDYYKIAARIAIALKEKNMTQKQLAHELGVTAPALTRIMKGRQNLSLLTIRKIEDALGVSLIDTLKSESNSSQVIWKTVTVRKVIINSEIPSVNIQNRERYKTSRNLKTAI